MQPDIHEALRYLGIRQPDEQTLIQMQCLSQELVSTIQPRMTWRLCSLVHQPGGILLAEPNILLRGQSARHILEDCHHAAIMVCTLGVTFDTMLRQRQKRDMAEAVMLDACGSAYVEAACDELEQRISSACPGLYRTDRFSPGYGDLALDVQKGLLSAADAARRVGVLLLPSLMMDPSKSVSAIVGLSDHPQRARIRGCIYCQLANHCEFRKRGETCEA